MVTFPLSLARGCAVGLLAGLLGGCPDSNEPASKTAVPSPASDTAARDGWLDPVEDRSPEIWLASREAGADVGPDSPAAAQWRALIADAESRYGDGRRMIANRAVQLEGMLQGIGIDERARSILQDFIALAPKGARRGFADLCQHYYNLRAQGVGRAEALRSLAAESGSTEARP